MSGRYPSVEELHAASSVESITNTQYLSALIDAEVARILEQMQINKEMPTFLGPNVAVHRATFEKIIQQQAILNVLPILSSTLG